MPVTIIYHLLSFFRKGGDASPNSPNSFRKGDDGLLYSLKTMLKKKEQKLLPAQPASNTELPLNHKQTIPAASLPELVQYQGATS